MGQLKQRMTADLARANYAKSTRTNYLRACERFAAHYMRSPEVMGRSEIRTYLDTLVDRPSRLKMAIAGLKYLYTHTLGRPEEVAWIQWPRINSKVPTILSGPELQALFAAMPSPKCRAVAMTACGSGLRVDEVSCTRGPATCGYTPTWTAT